MATYTMDRWELVVSIVTIVLVCAFMFIIGCAVAKDRVYSKYCGTLNMKYGSIYDRHVCYDKEHFEEVEWTKED